MKWVSSKLSIALLILSGAVLPPVVIFLLPTIHPELNLARFYRPLNTNLLPVAEYSFFEQILICFVAFGVKQMYEIMALFLIVKLWRKSEPEAVFLRYGLTAFLIGELSCAFNYLFFAENSLIMEYIHVFGMLVCFSFIAYTLLYILDMRIVKYSNRNSKCALLFFCTYCYKKHPVSCTARKIYQVMIPALLLFCLMPVTGELGSYFVVADIFGDPVVFGHSLAQQVMETILFPGVAAMFFIASLFVFLQQKEKGFGVAKVLLAAGIGSLGFSLLRFILFWSYKYQPIWADIWEELTEFLFVACTLYIVMLAFRTRVPEKTEKTSSELRGN